MCEPVTLSTTAMFYTSLAVTAAQGAFQYIAQNQAADAQEQVAAITQSQNQQAAARDFELRSRDLGLREQEEQEASSLRVFNQSLAKRRAASTAMASSESAGVSFDALLQDYDRQFDNFSEAEMTQLGFTRDQIRRSRDTLGYDYVSRATGQATSVSRPSILGTALGTLGDGVSAYNTFSTVDPDTGKRTIQ